MKIRLKAQYVSPAGIFCKDDEIDVPGKEARQLINAGYAESVNKLVETAVPVEIAVDNQPRRGILSQICRTKKVK
jgi:hypothetical protein